MIHSVGILGPELLLVVAVGVDLVFGEPPMRLHPVVWIGRLVSALERRLPREGALAFLSGLGLALFVPALVVGLSLGLLHLVAGFPLAATAVCIWLLKSSFSVRLLEREAGTIGGMLAEDRLEDAQQRLSHLCSRKAVGLRRDEVSGAVVESVAENTSDSFVAPLFWFCVLGLPGALMFRTVNTLDGMIGYRGEYELLGKASARFDDLLCWIPARLTALVFLCIGVFAGGNPKRGALVLVRDRHLTASPNAGFPMAAMAGLLGLRLAKRDAYVLGSEGADPGPSDIRTSIKVLRLTVGVVTAISTLTVFASVP